MPSMSGLVLLSSENTQKLNHAGLSGQKYDLKLN